MRVAILSPIAWRTPPEKYGPWEQVASNLAEGLVEKGWDVSLFATGNSLTKGRLEAICPEPYADNPRVDAKVNECLHISHLMERAGEFDIIHNHFDFLPLTYSRLINTPMVTTIHGFSSERIVPVYRKYNLDTTYVSISYADRHPDLTYCATVYNGIDQSQFSFQSEPEDYLLFFGRIHPEKGTRESIEVAKKTGRKLLIAGLIQDHGYFEREVEPHIDGDQIQYVGNCGPAERDQLLKNAYALLHLVSFDEPFGLSVAESMCTGTPVIAFNRGAMPELIADGVTGFLVDNLDEAIAAVNKIGGISRQACKDRVMEKFTVDKMIDGYLGVYEKVFTFRRARRSSSVPSTAPQDSPLHK